LSRGKQTPRPLGSIAELEPFFADGSVKTSARPVRTLHGVAPAAEMLPATASQAPVKAISLEPPPPEPTPAPPPPVRTAPLVAPSQAATDAFAPTLRTAEPGGQHMPPMPNRPIAGVRAAPLPPSALAAAVESPQPAAVNAVAPATLQAPDSVARPVVDTTLMSSGSTVEVQAAQSAPLPPPRDYMLTPSSPFVASPVAPELLSSPSSSSPFSAGPISSGRRELRSYDELTHEEIHEHGRRARSRWIAAFVIAGVTTLFALTVGRRYLLETAGQAGQADATTNGRVADLLREGNRLLTEGDLEGADEQLLKASALADKDHAVLAALAHLETLRADVSWLKLRLLDPSVTDLVQATHRELGRRVGKARSAADAAFAVAPEDIVVLRARVDTLRLSGDADKAREWIKPIASNPSDPQNAYVLAALDLSDQEPSWSSVIDRLRIASTAERSPGRAHAALIYALARSGNASEAEAELGRLDQSPSALLIDELKSFLKRYAGGKDAGAAASVATVDPNKLGKLDTTPTEEAHPAPARSATAPAAGGDTAKLAAGDFRKALADAAAALRASDLAGAEALYQRALNAQPGNTEALAGLADVARRRHDPATAARMYDRVLATNPSYLPALMARGDQEWDSGNKSAAAEFYKRVVEQAGSGSEYGQRAAARLAEGKPAASPRPAETPSEKPAEMPTPASPAPAGEIDTSDLPGFK
jgi:tetratricopeptide (TPR) repeat protein